MKAHLKRLATIHEDKFYEDPSSLRDSCLCNMFEGVTVLLDIQGPQKALDASYKNHVLNQTSRLNDADRTIIADVMAKEIAAINAEFHLELKIPATAQELSR